MKDRG
jgi:hypothetical protein